MHIILDVDGTLTKDIDHDDVLPDMLANCKNALERGDTLVLASNQGGVMLGYRTLEATLARIAKIAQTVGAADYYICTWHFVGYARLVTGHHPEAHYSDEPGWRKPEPGMLQYIIQKYGLTPQTCMYVGDRAQDKEAAVAAGIPFEWHLNWKVEGSEKYDGDLHREVVLPERHRSVRKTRSARKTGSKKQGSA
jgi:D-glycero-D-manno-heptose 1,7-bisphosphate phosphatase